MSQVNVINNCTYVKRRTFLQHKKMLSYNFKIKPYVKMLKKTRKNSLLKYLYKIWCQISRHFGRFLNIRLNQNSVHVYSSSYYYYVSFQFLTLALCHWWDLKKNESENLNIVCVLIKKYKKSLCFVLIGYILWISCIKMHSTIRITEKKLKMNRY